MNTSKPRKPPVRGVQIGYQPYCRECNWHDATVYGKGGALDAWTMLHEHIRKHHPAAYEKMLAKGRTR